MNLVPAIIFINGNCDGYGVAYGDLDAYTKSVIVQQLYIHESMTGTEFDARVVVDPNYPAVIHNMRLRILVIRSDFRDYTNRDLADIVLYFRNGMVSIEKNNFGIPSLTVSIDRLDIYKLLRYNESQYTMNLPVEPQYPYSNLGNTTGGIVYEELRDVSGVHDANPDNEFNNYDWIHRR